MTSADQHRLRNLTAGVDEANIVAWSKHVESALQSTKAFSLYEALPSWDRLATSSSVIHRFMPQVLKRGAELAVFDKNLATALPFLRAAAVLCRGWPAVVAFLLIAACCKELKDYEGMEEACDAFELSRSSLASFELRSMKWNIPTLDRKGYDPFKGPKWFMDEAAAMRYVNNVNFRVRIKDILLLRGVSNVSTRDIEDCPS